MKKIIKEIIAAAVLALALSAEANAQGLLEGIGQKIDALGAKVDSILKALQSAPPVTPPPPPVTPPPVPVCAAKFCVGDRVAVALDAGGARVRSAPDGNEIEGSPVKAGEGGVALAFGAKLADGRTWTQVKFDLGFTGWVTDGPLCKKPCDVVVTPPPVPPPPPPPVIIPPPPLEPIADASYYLSMDGSDANPGTLGQPFKTLQKAAPLLKAGDLLVVRAGTYNTDGFTKAGNDTVFTTGLSWDKPLRIEAPPGEKVKFVRDLAAGTSFTIEQVRAGVHAPTAAQCAYYNSQFGGYSPYPEGCVAGSPGGGWLWEFQDDTGATTPAIVDLTGARHQVRFLRIKNIDFDARGINRAFLTTSTMADGNPTAMDIQIIGADIGWCAASCFSQPGAADVNNAGVPNKTNIVVTDSSIHHCGIPFDPARKNPAFKFLHCFYQHNGGSWCIRCRIFDAAGGGYEPDGPENGLIDSVIFNNNCLGAQLGGGKNFIYTGNIFYNNGCAEIQLLSDAGHVFMNNTLIAGPANRELGAQLTFRNSLVANNIITGFKTSLLNLQPWDLPNKLQNNLIDGALVTQSGTIVPIESGTIKADPRLSFDPSTISYTLGAGSPALGAGTNGKNIGAK